jgi:hypothetical protein
MEEGKRYRVIYLIPGVHRRPREAVMAFLSEDASEYSFSLRPLAGTQVIDKKYVRAIYETQSAISTPTICHDERRVL